MISASVPSSAAGGTKRTPLRASSANGRRERLGRLFVGREDRRAARAQDGATRDAAAAEADHEHAFARVEGAGRVAAHRAIAAPASDSNADAVQKRAVTLVSGQPPSSK